VIIGRDELRRLVGQHLGESEWLTVTQEQVDRFVEVTGDRTWIHVDPQRAAASRFGGTVVPGYLILALIPRLLSQILQVPGYAVSMNYGCDRVRFLSPVPVGARLRAGAILRSVSDIRGGTQLSLTVVFRIRARRAPVCSARVIICNYDRVS
jgi:acyl dehydratase